MQITNVTGQTINTHKQQFKKVDDQPSPFGEDTVSIGNNVNAKSLSPGQLWGALEKSARNRKMPAQRIWSRTREDASRTTHNVISSKTEGFYSSMGNGILKMDADSGVAKWKADFDHPLGDESRAMWEAKDGSLLAVTMDGTLHSLDGQTGEKKWDYDMGLRFKYPVTTGEDGSIFTFRAEDNQAFAVRLSPDGKVQSKNSLGQWLIPADDIEHKYKAAPEILRTEKDGSFIAHLPISLLMDRENTFDESGITALIGSDGKVKWQRELTRWAPKGFRSDDKHIFYEDRNEIGAVDAKTGKTLWTIDREESSINTSYGAPIKNPYTIGGQEKYIEVDVKNSTGGQTVLSTLYRDEEHKYGQKDYGQEIICIDSKDVSKVLWKRETDSTRSKGPLYMDENIVLHIKNEDVGILEALDTKTGKPLWTTEGMRDPQVKSRQSKAYTPQDSPNLYEAFPTKDGKIVVMAYDKFFGLDPKTGATTSRVNAGYNIGGFALNEDSGKLLAVDHSNNDITAFVFKSDQEMIKETINDAAAKQADSDEIKMGEKTVNIGGVSLPINGR